ncbi:gene transfer agent family protein [Mesorhizobium sp. KR1-2]|uniref:gene transfer agent family protein n=1 Tax=Mesorhizobium sp. KR1-2 TaxID=3156609 RepID=UPI0032B468CD
MKHTAFFGDGEKTFALPLEQILELQRKTGAGIGSLCQRIPEGHFRLEEVVEIIRLALIGGGSSPKEAADLADAYAAKRPLAESFPIAVALLRLVWLGEPEPDAQDDFRQAAATGEASAILRARIAEAYAKDAE